MTSGKCLVAYSHVTIRHDDLPQFSETHVHQGQQKDKQKSVVLQWIRVLQHKVL